MTKTEKRLRAELKAAYEDMENLEKIIRDLQEDRSKFRAHFRKRFKWWISLLGGGSTPKLLYLIADDADFANSVESWFWS